MTHPRLPEDWAGILALACAAALFIAAFAEAENEVVAGGRVPTPSSITALAVPGSG